MTDRRLRHTGAGDSPLSPDQRAVFDAYFEDDGVVCTPAGSGTGKTTTAVETVAEAVVRELERAPDRNPFESILVTTFTRDAARQLRTAIESRLREHRRAAPDDDPVVRRWEDVLRWLETASNVRTIDSFTQDLLREVALEVGVAPSFGVADGIRRSDLLEEVFADLRADPDLADPIARLERAFPSDAGRESWESMVESVHAACREFCLPVPEARRALLRSVTRMHAGRQPDSFADLLAIVDELADYDPRFVRENVDDPDAWVAHARETYRTSRRLAGDFGVVLAGFDERYDRLTRERGQFTHTDITYLLREFLEGDPPETGRDAAPARRRRDRFAESLAGRFRHVVVDEFQDTNYAQCRVLAHLIDDDALLIGDLKQSIYEWRSAEPRLFAEVIEYADGDADGNVLDAEDVRTVPLTENFRSHPHLVRTANHVFEELFEDPGRGGIGTFDVDYEPLSARRVETGPDRAHVHALDVEEPDRDDDDRSRREARVEAEAERVAGVLRRVLDEESLRVDRDRRTVGDPPPGGCDDADDPGDLDPVRPGDVAVLVRTSRYVRVYSRVLDRFGIDNAVIGRHSLFREPEVGVLVDALAWLGRPDDRALVRRLAESPLVGLSADGIDRLARHRHDLDAAIAEWDGDERDRRELRDLAALREDLRYVRDGSKARLVSELLVHSAFDVAALADGLQRYANLRRFVEVIDGWEEEERLSYGEFVRRLERLRDGRIDDDTALADVADADSPETVKLLTAHTAKGQEFPVVVLGDTAHDEANRRVCDEPFVADRRHGLALRPSTGDTEQPPGAADAVPSFAGGWFHDDDSEFDRDRGLLWLSEIRGTDGRIRHGHPFRAAVRDRRAEFWRLLYVAVTRAGDHLVVPFHDPRSDGEWTTWTAALAEYLDPDGGRLETDDGPVPVSVDGIDPADPPEGETVDPAALLTGGRTRERPDPASDPDRRFRPVSLSATDVDAALDDPERFQRRVLRGAGTADPVPAEDAGLAVESVAGPDRAAPAATGGSGAPDDVRPDVWGTAVHAALEAVNGSLRDGVDGGAGVESAVDRAVADALGDHPHHGAVADRIRSQVLPAYRGSGTWRAVEGGRPAFPELAVAAPLSAAGLDGGGLLRGRIDLLYRPDGWRICEFKTGTPARPESERRRAYRSQLDAYAWLCRAVYGIDAGAELFYLPAGTRDPVDVDPDRFATRLAGLGELYVDRGGVLRRRDRDRSG